MSVRRGNEMEGAGMKEYIERAAAIKRIKEYSLTVYDINLDNKEEFAGNSLPENYCEGLYEATELLDDLPAADVAEVVRCAQCKYAKESKDAFDWDGKTPLCECAYMTQPNRWHEYCSWGKRKEDEHEAG